MDEAEEFFDTVEETELEQGGGAGATRYESVYELHKAAFNNDTKHLEELLQRMPQEQYASLDLHGNTALHVAALRGHTAAVELLLGAGLPARARSSRGWTAFDEACAGRHMDTARVLQQRLLLDAKVDMKQKRAQLLDSMSQMPDYSLQLKWQLGSAVPGLGLLLRKYAPHDTYTIWKVGDKLRVDGSLTGIDTQSLMPEWKRGHFSLIVDGSPEGMAAAAAAVEEALAAARKTAQQKQQQKKKQQQTRQPWHYQEQQEEQQQQGEDLPADHQQEQQQQQVDTAGHVSPAPEPLTPSNGDAANSSSNGGGSNDGVGSSTRQQDSSDAQQHHSSTSPPPQQDQQQQQQQQQFYDPEPAVAAGPGGPRLLFLNHVKGSWVDLSADKKALKVESQGEEEAELNAKLMAAMQRDMEKLRLKPRNFKFAPLKGWLGGDMTEKVEGWKCTVYEAAGKLLAVSTSKAVLQLTPTSSFEDYLGAEYAADAVSETLIDPLTPSGLDMMSSSKKDKSSKAGSSYGGSDSALGVDGEYDGLVWGEAPESSGDKGSSSSSSGSKKWGKKGGSGSSSKGGKEGAAAAAEVGGRVLRARCWMAQDFPMSLAQLLPLLDVIGNANKHMAKVGKFLAKYSHLEMFPVKLQVPLLLTVYALVSFKAFHLLQPGSGDPALAPDFFTVPPTYKRKLLQDMMDKAVSKGGFGGMGGDAGRDEWGDDDWYGQQRGVFYGGDEGAEYLQDDAEQERK